MRRAGAVVERAGAAADLAAVLVFVAIGRTVHAHGLSVAGLASTAWPFLVGLAVGWLALARGSGLSRTSLSGGLVVLISTVAIGMALRVVARQGIAFAFVLVALGFLGAAMAGWRVLLAVSQRSRSQSRSS